jgi:transposase InsO family protein
LHLDHAYGESAGRAPAQVVHRALGRPGCVRKCVRRRRRRHHKTVHV